MVYWGLRVVLWSEFHAVWSCGWSESLVIEKDCFLSICLDSAQEGSNSIYGAMHSHNL